MGAQCAKADVIPTIETMHEIKIAVLKDVLKRRRGELTHSQKRDLKRLLHRLRRRESRKVTK